MPVVGSFNVAVPSSPHRIPFTLGSSRLCLPLFWVKCALSLTGTFLVWFHWVNPRLSSHFLNLVTDAGCWIFQRCGAIFAYSDFHPGFFALTLSSTCFFSSGVKCAVFNWNFLVWFHWGESWLTSHFLEFGD